MAHGDMQATEKDGTLLAGSPGPACFVQSEIDGQRKTRDTKGVGAGPEARLCFFLSASTP